MVDETDATPAGIIRKIESELTGMYPPGEIRSLTCILFEEYLGWKRVDLHLRVSERLEPAVASGIDNAIALLKTGMPIQYITGRTVFHDLEISTLPGVLIPRPETEMLSSLAGEKLEDMTEIPIPGVLDIGTGTGCIAIYLKKRFPRASVTGLDLSPTALETARKNAELNEVAIRFVPMDITDPVGRSNLGLFNLIVSNPPYVTESERERMHVNVTRFEPPEALYVPDGDALLYYREITGFASAHLNPGGWLLFEINERFGAEVSDLVRSGGFSQPVVLKDFNDRDRFVISRWNPGT